MISARKFSVGLSRLDWVLALLLAADVGGGAVLFHAVREARAAERARAKGERSLASFRTVVPPPTDEVAESLAQRLEHAEERWSVLATRAFGAPPHPVSGAHPLTSAPRTDAYFDLFRFVEELRAMAVAEGVRVRAGESFGFSAYAQVPPAPEALAYVLRQKAALALLLTEIFGAHPQSLDSVRRESPMGGERVGRSEARRPTESSDYFTRESRVSATGGNRLAALSFQVVFTGQTSTLRTVLNRLMAAPVVWRVCQVEVERVRNVPELGLRDGKTANPQPAAIIREEASRFSLIVEVLDPAGFMTEKLEAAQ